MFPDTPSIMNLSFILDVILALEIIYLLVVLAILQEYFWLLEILSILPLINSIEEMFSLTSSGSWIFKVALFPLNDNKLLGLSVPIPTLLILKYIESFLVVHWLVLNISLFTI